MRRPWLGGVVVTATLLFTLSVFPRLPERIATHWNAAGEPDDWMARWPGAFVGVGLALGVWALLRLLPRLDPRRTADARFPDAYWLGVNLVISLMALLQVFIVGAALGWPMDAARLVLAAAALLLMTAGSYLPGARRNGWLGIRTPWTLESERVWRDTHRLAGWTSRAAGLLLLGAIVLPPAPRLQAVMGAGVVGGVVPAAYSYLARRRERRAEQV